MAPEGDQPTLRFDRLCRRLRPVPARSDVHLLSPDPPQELARVSILGVVVFDTGHPSFDHMQVSKVGKPLFCLRDKVGKRWSRIFHLHSLPSVPRGDAESHSILANSLGDRFDDFEREPRPVLYRSTVFVRPSVRHVLQELVWKVSVCEVKLDSVESRLVDGLVGCVGVPPDVSLDLVDRHRTWGWVGRRNGDGGHSDEVEVGILGFEQFDVCGATVSPELDEYV